MRVFMNGLVFGFKDLVLFVCVFYLRSSQLSNPKPQPHANQMTMLLFRLQGFSFSTFFFIMFFVLCFFIKKNVYFGSCGVHFVIIYIRFPSLSRLFCFPKSLTQQFFFFSKKKISCLQKLKKIKKVCN